MCEVNYFNGEDVRLDGAIRIGPTLGQPFGAFALKQEQPAISR
jgi:hypothetical protein